MKPHRQPSRSLAALLLSCLLAAPAFGQSAVDGFAPNPDRVVRAIAVQADGKILVGGYFTNIVGLPRAHLVRLNPDGTLDGTFSPPAGPEVNNPVMSLALQPGGKILLGGVFTIVNGKTRRSLARLHPDGRLDESLDAGMTDWGVHTLAVQADGKILVGGDYQILAGQRRNGLGRLHADGSLDEAFAPFGVGPQRPPLTRAYSLVVQADGSILVGGLFVGIPPHSRRSLARLKPDGSVAGDIDPEVVGVVGSLAVQVDGKVVIGGRFGSVAGQSRTNLARVNADLSLDTTFRADVDGIVFSLAVQPDGKIVVGGHFNSVGGKPRTNLARLHPDGSVDEAFRPAAPAFAPVPAGAFYDGYYPYGVRALAVQTDGNLLVGGGYTNLAGQARENLGRLYPDGSLDATLNPGAESAVFANAVQVNGKILVGGQFRSLGGQPRQCIGRLNADGTLDASFDPGANDSVYTFAVQDDGKILVGGWFTVLGGQQRLRIARLNSDGTLDVNFNPGVTSCSAPWCNAPVYALILQSDGKILVGGAFRGLAGQPRNHLGRLNADGSLDASFDPGASDQVRSLALQADGKILVAGSFTNLAGQTRRTFGRLNADGSIDAAFSPQVNGYVQTIYVQADGKILVGGSLSQLNGQTRHGIGRFNIDGSLDMTFAPFLPDEIQTLAVKTDGKITFGGDLFGRLHADGNLDASFDVVASSFVFSLVKQGDGKTLVGGSFSSMGGQWRDRLARLSDRSAAVDLLNLNDSASEIRWNRSGSGPEVEQVTFDQSIGGTNYLTLGRGVRMGSGWRLSGVSLLAGQINYVRARGRTAVGWNNASSSVIESVAQFWRLPSPFISSVQVLGGGVFQFSFTNTNAVAFSVLASSDVAAPATSWENLGAPLPVGSGIYQFTDPAATNHARRFYQLRSP